MRTSDRRPIASRLSIIWVLLTLVASCAWWGNTAKLTIVNKSGEDIDICSVKMSGSTISVRNLKPGGESSLLFSVKGDDHYEVMVQFADGRRFQQQVGYVTRGYNFVDTIEIRGDQVELTAHDVQKP
jgi:hypothetical protein